MFVEAMEGLAAAASIYEKRNAFLDGFRRLGTLIINGNKQVLVFGAGGTGKTTLGLYIDGQIDHSTVPKAYEETLKIEEFTFRGSVPAKLIVPPGQTHRRPGNWDQLFASISGGRAAFVIHMAAWGHHSTQLDRAILAREYGTTNDDEIRQRYLEDGRSRELQVLRELMPHIKSSRKAVHLLTVVGKQDLWWSQRELVKDFYTLGAYKDLLDELARHKGAANFHHDVISTALVEQNLRTPDGFEIAATTGGYDDAIRVSHLGALLSILQQMLKQ